MSDMTREERESRDKATLPETKKRRLRYMNDIFIEFAFSCPLVRLLPDMISLSYMGNNMG